MTNEVKLDDGERIYELYAYDINNKTHEKVNTSKASQGNNNYPISPNGKYMFHYDKKSSNNDLYHFKRGDVVRYIPKTTNKAYANWTYFDSIILIEGEKSANKNLLNITLKNIVTKNDDSVSLEYPAELCGGLLTPSISSENVMYLQTYYCGSSVDPVQIGPKSIPTTYRLTIYDNDSYLLEPISYMPHTSVAPTGRIAFCVCTLDNIEDKIYSIIISDGQDNILIGEVSKLSAAPSISLSTNGNLVVCIIPLDRPSWMPRDYPYSFYNRLIIFNKK